MNHLGEDSTRPIQVTVNNDITVEGGSGDNSEAAAELEGAKGCWL